MSGPLQIRSYRAAYLLLLTAAVLPKLFWDAATTMSAATPVLRRLRAGAPLGPGSLLQPLPLLFGAIALGALACALLKLTSLRTLARVLGATLVLGSALHFVAVYQRAQPVATGYLVGSWLAYCIGPLLLALAALVILPRPRTPHATAAVLATVTHRLLYVYAAVWLLSVCHACLGSARRDAAWLFGALTVQLCAAAVLADCGRRLVAEHRLSARTLRWALVVDIGSWLAASAMLAHSHGGPGWAFRALLAIYATSLALTTPVSLALIWLWWPALRGGTPVPLDVEARACLNCGYSLIGNTSGRCPECGQPVVQAGDPAPAPHNQLQ